MLLQIGLETFSNCSFIINHERLPYILVLLELIFIDYGQVKSYVLAMTSPAPCLFLLKQVFCLSDGFVPSLNFVTS